MIRYRATGKETLFDQIVTFDLDGTLADNTHRLHFLEDCDPKDWTSYHSQSINDIPIDPVVRQLNNRIINGAIIIIVTARLSAEREDTHRWIKAHNISHAGFISFRPTPHWSAEAHKAFTFDAIKKRYGKYPLLHYDDDIDCLLMAARKGIRVIDVKKKMRQAIDAGSLREGEAKRFAHLAAAPYKECLPDDRLKELPEQEQSDEQA